MENRESTIEKLEAWARWELGATGFGPSETSVGGVISCGFLPGDQADHLTVELAIKEFNATAHHKGTGVYEPTSLRALLLHVYGRGRFPESFSLFDRLRGEDERETRKLRNKVRGFLMSFGWPPDRFSIASVRRFAKFLSERLLKQAA